MLLMPTLELSATSKDVWTNPAASLDTLTWTWHQSYGAMGCLWLTLCQWSSVFEVWYFSRTQNCHKIQTPEKWMKSTTCKHLAVTSSLFTIITFCDCVSPLKKIYILLPLKKKTLVFTYQLLRSIILSGKHIAEEFMKNSKVIEFF